MNCLAPPDAGALASLDPALIADFRLSRAGDSGIQLRSQALPNWDTYGIICRSPEITLFINGTLMCQFTDHDAKQAASKGSIALQMHPGPPIKINSKNIRLKEM